MKFISYRLPTLSSPKSRLWIAATALSLSFGACSTAPGPQRNPAFGGAPVRPDTPPESSLDTRLKSLGMSLFSANLHSHHYVGPIPQPNACQKFPSRFPEDDGRPCSMDAEGKWITALPSEPSDGNNFFFKAACETAANDGKVDALWITLHTKNNQGTGAPPLTNPDDASDDDERESEGGGDTDSTGATLAARAKLIRTLASASSNFVCGLGQEASSISTGNHINIFGHFRAVDTSSNRPFFFPSGDFRGFYDELGTRRKSGEHVFIQLNHPKFSADFVQKPISEISGKRAKEALNDYGIDDFGPVGCIVRQRTSTTPFPECTGNEPDRVTDDLLAETLMRIQSVSNNGIRLIETIGPLSPTQNAKRIFSPVHSRKNIDDNARTDGIKDFITYTAMGLKLGPTANQDNHFLNHGSATASRTRVLASGPLSERTLLSAMEGRHTVASEDENARVLIESVSPGGVMGDEVTTSQKQITVRISYVDPDGHDESAEIRMIQTGDQMSVAQKRSQKFRSPLSDQRLRIYSGKSTEIVVDLKPGSNTLIFELTQAQDFDKLVAAPLWVTYLR